MAEGDYACEVDEEDRKGIWLVVLGAYTHCCAWMHHVQAPDPIQDQVRDVPNQALDLQDSACGGGSCEATIENQYVSEQVQQVGGKEGTL